MKTRRVEGCNVYYISMLLNDCHLFLETRLLVYVSVCFSPSPYERLSTATQSYGKYLVNCGKWKRIRLYKVIITFPRSTASQNKTYNNKKDHLQPKLTSHTIWLLSRFAYANFDHFLCVSRLKAEVKHNLFPKWSTMKLHLCHAIISHSNMSRWRVHWNIYSKSTLIS